MIWTEVLPCGNCCVIVWAILPEGDGSSVRIMSALTTPEQAPALAAELAAAAMSGALDVLPDLDALEAQLDELDANIAQLREAAAT